MLQPVLLLVFLLHSATGDIATKLSSKYSDILKIKCDALPYRTVFHESNCYFVIDADIDSVQTTKQCSRVLAGAKLTGNAPDYAYNTVFAHKSDFLRDGESTGQKKKAMCVYDVETQSSDLAGSQIVNVTNVAEGTQAENQKIIYELPVPFGQHFKLKVGQTIVVKSTCLGASEFVINLYAGSSIALHFDVRFYSGVIELNTFIGNWQAAARVTNPLRPYQPFEIRILTHDKYFQIFLDQGGRRNQYTYTYRMPLASINIFGIGYAGAGTLNYVDLADNSTVGGHSHLSTPSPSALEQDWSVCKEVASYRDICPHAGSNRSALVNSRRPNCKSLVISGQSDSKNPNGYIKIYLKNGDIALNFSPRFFAGKVLMNSQKGGKWGTEQWENSSPFKKLVPFEAIFTIEPCAFQISVGGMHYTFAHRMPPVDIAKVRLEWMINVGIQIK